MARDGDTALAVFEARAFRGVWRLRYGRYEWTPAGYAQPQAVASCPADAALVLAKVLRLPVCCADCLSRTQPAGARLVELGIERPPNDR